MGDAFDSASPLEVASFCRLFLFPPDSRCPLALVDGGSALFGAGGRFLSRDQKKGTEKCSHLWVTYPVVSHTPQPRDMVRQDRRGTSGSDGNDGGHPLLR